MTAQSSTPSAFDVGFSASGLTLARGGRRILAGVSLEAKPGEAIVLRGPNGAGKTTLLRALAGLLRPESGVVAYHAGGAETDFDPGEHVVFCGALNAVKASLSVDENLAFWSTLYGSPAGKRAEARRAFGLDPYADRAAGALSTGLMRRLGLARLLIAERPLWLVDEPTASLDAASAAVFTEIVEEHRRRGGLAVIAAHDDVPLADARTIELAMEAPR